MLILLAHTDKGTVITQTELTLQGYTVPLAFESDGMSCPKFLWSTLGYHPLHHKVLKASLLHDHLIEQGADGRHRDKLFYRQLLEDGVPKGKAKIMYWAVRKYRQATT